MNKEFVPYELALALKDIGYQSPNPIGGYRGGAIFYYDKGSELFYDGLPMYSSSYHEGQIIAPLYQQAFRWFREKYNLQVYIDFYHKDSYFYKIKSQVGKEISNTTGDVILQGAPVFPRSYEEAELECLKKLIEIVKEK